MYTIQSMIDAVKSQSNTTNDDDINAQVEHANVEYKSYASLFSSDGREVNQPCSQSMCRGHLVSENRTHRKQFNVFLWIIF